jgi:hypothetical protein
LLVTNFVGASFPCSIVNFMHCSLLIDPGFDYIVDIYISEWFTWSGCNMLFTDIIYKMSFFSDVLLYRG